MIRFLHSKNIFLLLLCLFVLPVLASAQQPPQKPLGRFWEYIYDPSNPAFTAQKNAVVNFMKENFDENNIPLISIVKLAPTGGKLYGIDSVYKHSPEHAIMRWKTWYKYLGEQRKLDYPWFNYRGYAVVDEKDEALGALSPSGTKWTQETLLGMKYVWDSLETKKGIKALMPITAITSEIKDGYISGNMTFTAGDPEMLFTTNFLYNVILAEGYHKYGTEEHYFIPRAALSISSMPEDNIEDYIGTTKEVPFKFYIDKSWNTKYLYVIGIVERWPLTPEYKYITRWLLDAAVDRVVDVKTVAQHTPLKLNVVHNTDALKCSKVATNSSTDIVFRVENSSNSAVTAIVYIDSTTSLFNNWTITKDVDTISIPPGGNTRVTVKAQSTPTESAAAFDLAVLPINVAANVNPIISNALTVVATDNVSILGLAEKNANVDMINTMTYPFFSNSYADQFAAVPFQYYSVINPDLFSAFIVSYGSPYKTAKYEYVGNLIQGGQAVDESQNTLFASINANINADLRNELALNNILNEAQVRFLNDIITKGKHLALFMDRTATYSSIAGIPTSEKTELQKLFTNFGVSFRDETYRLVADNEYSYRPHKSQYFNVTGVGTEQLSKDLDITLNNLDARSVAYTTNWTIAAPNTTHRVFSYKDITNSNAAVRTTKNESKLFLAGFGLESATDATLMSQNGFTKFFDNLTIWWFGAKPEPKPIASADKTSLDFGQQMINTNNNNIMSVVISNNATEAKDILRIYSSNFNNNADGSFSTVEQPASQIAAGQKDTIHFKFVPKSIKKYSDVTYVLSTNDANNSEISISLTGEGVETTVTNPVLSIDQSLLNYDFGEFTVDPDGNEYADKMFSFSNSGNAPLIINSIKFSDETDATAYAFRIGNTATTVSPGASHSFMVRFTALEAGVFDGKVEIHSNDISNPIINITLKATVATDINEEIAKVFNCNVSPVPANDLLNVDFNVVGELAHNVKLSIIDQTGRTLSVITKETYIPGNYKKSINVQSLAAGPYFLEYVIDDMRAVVPFSIAR